VDLEKEMKAYVEEYISRAQRNDRKGELMMRRMRLKHPILHLLTINAFKYLFDNA
jgi:hypothetical protein